ncbi:MAG: acetolactate synthase large subunit [Nitrospinota bacterium]
MRAADLFVKCLEAEGVRYVFGLPGEEILDLVDALCASEHIRFVTTRHEQGAAFMADVYGRLTGKAGVCLSTLGPGATNLITGVADANLDRAPLVAITGQAGLDRTHKESHQYIDIVDHFRAVTKWNVRVQRASVIPEVVRKAFKLAQAEKPGACHIELPEDIAEEEAEGLPAPPSPPVLHAPEEGVLQEAARRIAEARRPIILAGNGVIRTGASPALRAFVETARIPVATTFMGKGAVSSLSPYSLQAIGLQMNDYVSVGFDQADLVIAVGYDLAEYAPKLWNPAGDKGIIHIDSTEAEVDREYCCSLELVGDMRATLDALRSRVQARGETSFHGTLRDIIRQELEEKASSDEFPMVPQRILHDLRGLLGPEDILISDVGAHKMWVARLYRAYEPGTVIISNGFASMGIALPGAIAAGLVHPERKVAAVCGDGGFLMNVQELETAKRLGVKFVVLIWTDGSYGLIDWKQRNRFSRAAGVEFGNPDWVKLAESFGLRGYRPSDASELLPCLQAAFEGDGPAIVDVAVDYRENLRLTDRLGSLVCPI